MIFSKHPKTESFLEKTGLSIDDALKLSEEQLREEMVKRGILQPRSESNGIKSKQSGF